MENSIGEFLEVQNGRLFYTVTGEGDPLVFIHGNFTDSRIWEYQIECFAHDHTVICYDQRGYGRSDTPVSAFSPVKDLKAILDAVEVEKAVVIGSSSGGSVAVDFALRYPELVKALVLAAPSVSGCRYPFRVTVEAMKCLSALRREGFDAAIDGFIDNPFWQYLIPPPHRPKARETVLRTIRTQQNFYSWDLRLSIPQKPSASTRLREIHIPALIVLSDGDKDFNIRTAERIFKGIKNAEKLVVPDCGHLLFVEKPDVFNQAVLRFLEETA